MDYLKNFDVNSNRVEYENSDNYKEPYTSLVDEDYSIHYNTYKALLTLNDGRTIRVKYNNIHTDTAITEAEVSEYKPYVTDVVIGDKVTTLGSGVFNGCTKLENIEFSDSVTTIGSQSFRGCVGLTNIEIPDSVTSIGIYAFNACSKLNDIDFGNGIKTINEYSFMGCSGLTSITIPDSVTSIGNNAFCYNSSITSVTLGNSVSYIGANAFYQNKITEITLPNSLKTIQTDAFIFTLLTDVFVPSGVTSVAGGAFASTVLSSITVDSNNAVYDSRDNCNAIIETSTNALVQGCKTTIIPNTVTSIGTRAFEYSYGLTSITIPNSVTSIGQTAFFRCYNLQKITCCTTVAPTITNTTFQDVHTNGKLIVPRNSSGYETWMQTTNYYLGKYNWTMEELPYDAEIEYLESNGTQYIDLDIVPNVTDNVYCEFMLVSPLSNKDGSATVFGTFTAWAKNGFALVGSPAKSSANIYFLRGNGETIDSVTWNSVCDKWLIATINSNTATFLGKTLINNNTASINLSLYLFAANYNGTSSYGLDSIKRIRKLQYKRNNELIMDLIPVRDGQIGYMYDKVSNQLLGNSGTGDFILGPDI